MLTMTKVWHGCLQVAAGAQVILTQPPLDWPAFERWMDDARRRGLHEAARLLIGFPCLSSSSNCGFWLALCNAGNNAEARSCCCCNLADHALINCVQEGITTWLFASLSPAVHDTECPELLLAIASDSN